MANDAYCVRAYETIRAGVGGNAVRLSEGRNLYPPSPAFLTHVGQLMESLLKSDRLTYYESRADEMDRELTAALLEQYLDYPGIEAQHVLFTNGSQEAISIISSFCALQGLPAILPLPLYYSYEQSSLRWGGSINGYYRADGKVKWLGAPAGDLFQVILLPNFVTGTLFENPRLETRQNKIRLTLIDCIYQLGAYGGPGELAQATRAAIGRFSLDEVALLFTASKDLSLPGLRASVLVSGNKELMKYAREDRFERVYSVNPILGQTMATYFALLLINESRKGGTCETLYRDLQYKFTHAGAPTASLRDFLSMCEHFDGMTAHCEQNLRSLVHPLQLDLKPFAGYSVFPKFQGEFENSAEFLQWANYAGRRHGLKLNPAYIFGGTPELWEDLYPGEARVRVNVSYPHSSLSVALQRLETAARGVVKV